MFEDFAPKLAHVLTEYCLPVGPGDYVAISADMAAEPLIEALYERVLRCGAHPKIRTWLPNISEIYLRFATDDQLAFVDPADMEMWSKIDVLYAIRAASNTRQYSSFSGERIAQAQQAQRSLQDKYNERVQSGEIRWNLTLWPTQAAAQDAEMGLMAYREFVYNACGLNHDDPVAYWRNFRAQQERLVAWLEGKHHADVHGPGIELSFDFSERPWVSCHGILNFPDGEIYTSPIEDSVNGHVEFNYPSVYSGRETNGVHLVFRDGLVVEASADKGEDYLMGQIDMDPGARRLGEFAIGTNMGIQRFTREILFDEKIGGSIHMALGNSKVLQANGQNESAIHWDMVHNMKEGGEILIDGELFYRAGEFLV
jgi:aminopeptidase